VKLFINDAVVVSLLSVCLSRRKGAGCWDTRTHIYAKVHTKNTTRTTDNCMMRTVQVSRDSTAVQGQES